MFPISDHQPSYKLPFINILIILANILVFLIELNTANIDLLLTKYALIPLKVDFFDISTLYPFITSMFLHGGWFHLISNMWFLWIFGDNLESYFHHLGFLLFYLVCGLGGGLLQYFFISNSQIPNLGASGAIAGVLGGYLVLFPNAQVDTLVLGLGGFLHKVQLPAYFMLFYWFITQLFSGGASIISGETGSGVAWWAHIGGFISGFIIAITLKQLMAKKYEE